MPRTTPRELSAIACGGALGALARYALASAFPHAAGAFPWATFVTNVSGCFLIGVLMVVWPKRRLFLGVGVLGGFTTFSTYVVETQLTLTAGEPGLALLYFAGTAVTAVLAVVAGTALAKAIR